MKKPIKVLIIDDEYLIRNLLKKCIDWEELGAEIIGEAGNAAEAERIIEMSMPDIVLTDICMPMKDGLQMSEGLMAKYPKMKVVVITGYDDIEYAKKCIRLGVSDFLVKPLDDEELKASIQKMIEEISASRKKEEEFISLQKRVKEFGEIFNINSEEQRFDGSINIEEVKEYIVKNIANPKLSLKTVADNFYVNSSYMSRLFKIKTEQNFTDYLLEVKMTLAIKLLKESSLKSYEVARCVGIEDASYFSTCFRKYTGISIKEFKAAKDTRK